MAGPPAIPGALEWFISRHRWPNETMYHYTSRGAAENILANREMWASDLRSMNDPDELGYGRTLLAERFEKAVSRASNRARKLWLKTVYGQFIELVADRSSSFAISLSAEPDLPQQWRDYAARGEGVALGWSIDSDYPGRPLKMWVTYDRGEQARLADGLIDQHLAFIDRAPSLDAAFTSGLSLLRFLDVLLQTFKSTKWAAEREFRYVYQFFDGYTPGEPMFKTRTIGSVEKRYIEADFSTALLRHVVIGPGAEPVSTLAWLRGILHAHNYGDIPISRSTASRAR
jgi:hypothetical protein